MFLCQEHEVTDVLKLNITPEWLWVSQNHHLCVFSLGTWFCCRCTEDTFGPTLGPTCCSVLVPRVRSGAGCRSWLRDFSWVFVLFQTDVSLLLVGRRLVKVDEQQRSWQNIKPDRIYCSQGNSSPADDLIWSVCSSVYGGEGPAQTPDHRPVYGLNRVDVELTAADWRWRTSRRCSQLVEGRCRRITLTVFISRHGSEQLLQKSPFCHTWSRTFDLLHQHGSVGAVRSVTKQCSPSESNNCVTRQRRPLPDAHLLRYKSWFFWFLSLF